MAVAMMWTSFVLALLSLSFSDLVHAYSVPRALTAYAPVAAVCPTTPLIRAADGVGAAEQQYLNCRYAKAQAGLEAWLAQIDCAFAPETYPVVGLTVSGGGYRSLLEGAGVIQGFDARDSNTKVSGLLQALTYQAGLSGGSWLLSSFAANNYPTITSLKTGLWEQAFQNSLFLPENLLAAAAYGQVSADLASKQLAGFPPTLTDPWGRLLSYQLLYGVDGGVSDTMSGISTLSNFTGCNVPFPIITALGVKTQQGECLPEPNATQYEFSPFEFGSWDQGVRAFTQTAYLGSSLSNGKPTNGTCIKKYDNQGYVLGTSSNLFNEACASSSSLISPTNSTTNIISDLAALVNQTHALTTRDLYAVYPNPFYKSPGSPLVSSSSSLSLVDGGEALQNNPIWPFLYRSSVSVLIVNDNSADSNNFPNGSEILTTYVQARSAGLTRMPAIPSVDTFISQGLNQRPTFFGCNTTDTLTIIYLPNFNYTFASNQPTLKFQYTVAETDAMIANGVQIANKGGDQGWPLCLACGIMNKSGGTLPVGCATCYSTYCFN